MNHHDNSHHGQAASRVLGRRDVLRIGGFTVATAAVISACGEHARGEVGRVGAVPTTVKLPDAIVNNVVLLRTASSMEHSMINVYSQVIGNSELLDPKYDDVAKRFMDDHVAHAKLLEKLTTAAGGTPWTCSNPKFDDVVVDPVIARITVGAPATSTSEAIPPSDDPRRDILNFVHGLESLVRRDVPGASSRCSPSRRCAATAMTIGARESRHAALLALTINPARPGGQVNFSDAVNAQPASPPTTVAPTTTVQDIATPAGGTAPAPVQQTEIPTVTAVPSQFGSLAPIQIVVGAGDRERHQTEGQHGDAELQLVHLRVHEADLLSCSYTDARR